MSPFSRREDNSEVLMCVIFGNVLLMSVSTFSHVIGSELEHDNEIREPITTLEKVLKVTNRYLLA